MAISTERFEIGWFVVMVIVVFVMNVKLAYVFSHKFTAFAISLALVITFALFFSSLISVCTASPTPIGSALSNLNTVTVNCYLAAIRTNSCAGCFIDIS